MDDRTIRVCGLPVDIPKNRLSDKLKIHFLRKKNGGGDISSITFSETTPGVALITFTDCGVAQRVISHGFQTLSVNDILYTMTLSILQKELDPDEIFIDITVKVDHSKLPGGKKALSDILVNFPGLKMNFQPSDDLCILNGHYSEVQALIKYMLSVMNSKSTKDIQLPRSEVLSDQKKYHSTKRKVKSQSENEFAEQRCGVDISKCSSSERSHIPPHQASSTNRSVASRAGKAGTSQEDFSMIIDTDIFRYLQHCSKEYKSILDRHGVEVLDVTTKDITTLYLQLQTGVDGDVECMERTHVELGSLYENTEAQLRKVSLPKGGLPIQGLQQALDVVLQTFPDLMINEDKVNVYLVGSGTDVSEAKQFLMDIEAPTDEHGPDKIKLPNIFVQPSGTVSLSYMPEAQVDQHDRNKGAKVKMDTNFEKVVSSDKSKCTFRSSRGEVKTPEDDLTYPLLITKPNEKENLSLDCRPVSEIMSLKVQSSLSAYRPEDFKPLIETGEDTPFMRNGPVSINRLTPSSFSNSNRAKCAANSGKLQSNSLDFVPTSVYNVAPTNSVEQSKSGSTHRKVNSFSVPERSKGNGKTDHLGVYLQGKMPSCISSSQKPVRCSEPSIFSVDVEVPKTKWLYLKQFYLTEIEDLTSDLQMNEDNARGKEIILNLRGADAANVGKTQQGLKDLVSKVCEDFHTEELLKAHVGVSDSMTVEDVCCVVKDKFEKVLILQMTRSIFVLGPKLHCQDAMLALKELFLNGSEGEKSESPVFNLQQETKQDEDFTKGMVTESLAARTNKENAVSAALCLWCQGKVNPHCRMCCHSDSIDMQSSHNKHSEVNQREYKPVGRTVEKPALLCVCGSTAESVTLMACGVNLCSNCKEKVHSKCRVCTKPEESVSGIRGTMSFTEMSFSLAGYHRDTTRKITYTIPDGIQGADHPNPGSPFKGDIFHAYLPMNETTNKLVSSLEQAFHQGITFCVRATDSGDKVTWGRTIPHKTNIEGGKSKNGFPDSSYLKCLSEALTSQLVKESKHLK
ncbi:uncharacterized protein LOC134030799 [Osmerus eperlanus]|uniref:uncharacterized protein LOC134030799 n=1 Tax=Osmerus eperlanus TaxID=29151 RepID=UPI002E10BD85